MFEFCLLFLQIAILVAVLFHTQANHFFVVTHAILLLNYWLPHKFKLLQYSKFNYLTMYLPHISNSWLTEINVFCNIYIYIYIYKFRSSHVYNLRDIYTKSHIDQTDDLHSGQEMIYWIKGTPPLERTQHIEIKELVDLLCGFHNVCFSNKFVTSIHIQHVFTSLTYI